MSETEEKPIGDTTAEQTTTQETGEKQRAKGQNWACRIFSISFD